MTYLQYSNKFIFALNSNLWQWLDLSSLERGFVAVKSAQKPNITAKLQENVELRVEIEAYPPPQIRWKKDGATVKADKSIIIRQEHEIRWDIYLGPAADLRPLKMLFIPKKALAQTDTCKYSASGWERPETLRSCPSSMRSPQRNPIPSRGLRSIIHHAGTINTTRLSQLTHVFETKTPNNSFL